MTSERFQLIKSSTINTGFALALTALILLGCFIYLHMARATAASRSALRMHIVESEFAEVVSLLRGVETSERGYVITGDKSYLEPYRQALDEIDRKIARLDILTRDNRRQQQHLKEIKPLIRARLDSIKEVVEARSHLGFTAAQQLIQTDKGQQLMDELRTGIAEARRQEMALLEKQIADTETITKRLTALLLIGGILSLTILLAAFLLLTQEIKFRRKAQERAAQSEQRFESFMRHLPGAAFIKDLEGKYMYANPELGRIFGKPLEDILGKTDADMLPPETALHFKENDRRALKEGSIETVERLRQPDGLEHYSIVSKFGVPGPHDKPAYIGGIAYDITERKKAEDALRESEQRFRTMADNISQLAWMADENGSFFWLNKRAYDYTGAAFAAVQGSGWTRLVHPIQLKQLVQKTNECLRAGTLCEDTVLIRGREGDYRWFLCRAIPVHDEKDRVIRWFGTATDIHELKQTQQALQESEEKFRMLAENAGAIIGIMQDAKIIYANPFAETASGYTRQELYTIDIPKLIHPDYQKLMMERAQRRQAGEQIESHYEFIMVRKDGRYRWLDFSPIMIYYRGRPAIIGMAFDITERKKAEEALRESEETFRLMAENARAIIGIVQEEHFVYVNPYLEELSGYTRQEVLQMPIGQLVHPDSRAQVLDRARRRQAGEQVETHYEFAMLSKSGQKKWLDFSVTAIHYHGRPAVVGIAIDITDRKSIEQDLKNYKDQLENKNKELESIIGIVSHDLRAPLVNIQGFSREIKTDCKTVDTLLAETPVEQKVEMQLDKLLHHDIPESLRFILTSTDAMNKLVASLVEVARAGLMPTKPEIIDMNVLIKQILQSVEIKIKRAGVSYDIEDMSNCRADKTQVEQIFRNLLDNAIKYLDPNRPGQLCIGGKMEAGSSLYWVADNGIGISFENQEKIFEPYYQLKEKTSGGMGMGLATVRKLVDRNQGKIWVISEKGKGSTFYVALPKPNPD